MMPRRLVFAIGALAMFAFSASSQTTPLPTNDNLYFLALQASILQMEKEWGHFADSVPRDEIPVDYHNMIVEKDPVITDKLPTSFENHSVRYLNTKEMIDRYKKRKKSFEILKITPVRNEGNLLKIVIGTYWFSYKKHRAMFAYSDWSDVEIRYSCEQGAFVITSVKLGGI
jgi:hypothetical protein